MSTNNIKKISRLTQNAVKSGIIEHFVIMTLALERSVFVDTFAVLAWVFVALIYVFTS